MPRRRPHRPSALAALAEEAHRDARQRLERLIGISLDPIPNGTSPDWHYPEGLQTSVLQGYLGELLAGLIAENYQPHGRAWVVPAFLFRAISLRSRILSGGGNLEDRLGRFLGGRATTPSRSRSTMTARAVQLETASWL